MRELLGLLRAGWLTALSYRMNLVFSVLGLGVSMVPLYFVARALQPVAAESIQREGGEYFAFVLLGLAVYSLVSSSLLALPNAISGAIGSGLLEAIMATPARLPPLLLGMVGYELSWSAVRASMMVLVGLLLGIPLALSGIPVAFTALLLVTSAYFGLGLCLAAMVLTFRTVGPLGSGLLGASALLGGVYYSTSVIPSWIQHLSVLVPLTYGLRVMRQALFAQASLSMLGPDLAALAGLALLLLLLGGLCFSAALRHARQESSLGQY